ncbi:polysaccharide deacetylase family protein [Mycolicibacterium sp. XJ662]
MTIIPILLYHSVSKAPASWIAPFAVTPTMFTRHVEQIATSGRTAMTVSGLCAALAGDSNLPAHPVVITFDDGFADFAYAAEILATNGLPSTLYATTGALAGRGPRAANLKLPPAAMLDWSQLLELTELGVEIGAHTHTHPQLDIMSDRAAADEIRCSKDMLEDALGFEVPSFAYPHGFQSMRTRRVAASVGHRSACAVLNALSSHADEPIALARLTVTANTTPFQLREWLNGRCARVAPYPERLRTKLWRSVRRMRGDHATRGVFDNTTKSKSRNRTGDC